MIRYHLTPTVHAACIKDLVLHHWRSGQLLYVSFTIQPLLEVKKGNTPVVWYKDMTFKR